MVFSGLCVFFFCFIVMEFVINNNQMLVEERIENIVLCILVFVLDDICGLREYWLFVLRNILWDMLEYFEGGIF